MSAPISEHISAPTGKSEEPDEDVCAFCNCPTKVHLQEQSFQKQEMDGSMADGNRKGRYCEKCMKMCWR